MEEALKAIEYENVATVQIIYNMFRHKPDEAFLKKQMEKCWDYCSVPLASGMLTGKMTKNTHLLPMITVTLIDKGNHLIKEKLSQELIMI